MVARYRRWGSVTGAQVRSKTRRRQTRSIEGAVWMGGGGTRGTEELSGWVPEHVRPSSAGPSFVAATAAAGSKVYVCNVGFAMSNSTSGPSGRIFARRRRRCSHQPSHSHQYLDSTSPLVNKTQSPTHSTVPISYPSKLNLPMTHLEPAHANRGSGTRLHSMVDVKRENAMSTRVRVCVDMGPLGASGCGGTRV